MSTGRVRLTRKVEFSSGHRYWLPKLTAEQNATLFGQWAGPYNHGHNYVLSVTTEGRIDPETGMVVNIKAIDQVLKQAVVAEFDQRSINDEIPYFEERAPSLENLLLYIRSKLFGLPKEASLVSMSLEETPRLWGDLTIMNPSTVKITLTRSYEFAAAHRLHVPSRTDEQNIELFGKCNNVMGHGHNYVFEVTVSGEPDATTGMIVDLESLDRVVNERVVDRYDHKNLNTDIPEFQDGITTSEVVTLRIFDLLKDAVPARLERVRLHETARNMFEVSS